MYQLIFDDTDPNNPIVKDRKALFYESLQTELRTLENAPGTDSTTPNVLLRSLLLGYTLSQMYAGGSLLISIEDGTPSVSVSGIFETLTKHLEQIKKDHNSSIIGLFGEVFEVGEQTVKPYFMFCRYEPIKGAFSLEFSAQVPLNIEIQPDGKISAKWNKNCPDLEKKKTTFMNNERTKRLEIIRLRPLER